jgi:hypothetical protein
MLLYRSLYSIIEKIFVFYLLFLCCLELEGGEENIEQRRRERKKSARREGGESHGSWVLGEGGFRYMLPFAPIPQPTDTLFLVVMFITGSMRRCST